MQYGKFYIDGGLAVILGVLIFMGTALVSIELKPLSQRMALAGMEQVVVKVNGEDAVIWKKAK